MSPRPVHVLLHLVALLRTAAHVDHGDRRVPDDRVWMFGVHGHWTLVCSPMHETKTGIFDADARIVGTRGPR